VASCPMVIPSSKVKLLNKVDIYVPQWISTFGGVISFLLVKELTVHDIIEQYIHGGEKKESILEHSSLKEPQFIDLSVIQDLKNSIQRKGTFQCHVDMFRFKEFHSIFG
jgi:hypothetical protein